MKYGLSPPMRRLLADMRERESHCRMYFSDDYQWDIFYSKADIAHSIGVINDIRKEVVFHQLQEFLADKVAKSS